MDNNVKIKGKEKFFYGMGDLSANILLAAFSFYLLFFMVSIGGLKPALASLVFLSAKIWDAVTDIWMGRIMLQEAMFKEADLASQLPSVQLR